MRFVLPGCAIALALTTVTAEAQFRPGDPLAAQPMTWVPVRLKVPPGVAVFSGEMTAPDGRPVRAWYARISSMLAGRQLRARLSSHATGKEPLTSLARDAAVAINGGYYDMTARPARTFSLVRSEGKDFATNIGQVPRTIAGVTQRYPVTRAALGRRSTGQWEFAWVHHLPEDLYAYTAPAVNSPGRPSPLPGRDQPDGARPWKVTEALGGGPMLVWSGYPKITYTDEVFWGSGFAESLPYPRAAVGLTPRGDIILLVVDGRQPGHSMGLTLAEMAAELIALECRQAMNLDGGGSATLVVSGQVLNRPSDGRERAITSALVLVADTR